jgi:cyclophilin family peptidyl-prolyl cis-trans isomerase/HEAT repeat protein
MNRRLALLVPFLAVSCITPTPAPPPPPPAPVPVAVVETPPPAIHGFTLEEEAQVLRLEDRREYDPAVVSQWLGNANPLHRSRMAMALGHIGVATFADANANAQRDPDEHQAGVTELIALTNDPDPSVRRAAAFALGHIGDAAGLEALFSFAHDSVNGDVAAEAVEALSKLGTKVPLNRYAELANDPREGVKARAIRFLFRLKSDEASALASTALESPSPAIRREGAYTLSRRAYAPARQKLELMMSDADNLTRSFAARALGAIGDKESMPSLVAALGDANPWVRTNAATSITRMAAKDAKLLDTATFAQDAMRVMTLTEDLDPGTRASAVDTLGWYAMKSEAARKRLLEIATNGSRWERELAAGAVARDFGEAADSPLDTLLANANNWEKVRILEGSAALKTKGPALRRRLSGDPSAMVRVAAIGNIPDEAIDAELALVRAAMTDPDVVVREAAIGNYAKNKLDSTTLKLAALHTAEESARKEAQNDARLSAIRAIASLDDPSREPFLRRLLTDPDPVVRRIAADQIEKLPKPRPQFTPLAVRVSDPEYLEVVRWSRQPHTATIHMTRGNIVIQLLAQDAPLTVWNFAQLAKRGYFDNSSFMRVVPNFVIQGGDPRNDMSGGPGYAIRDEINMQKYTRGAVGMALSGPDTGGSQFFITHSPQPHLDGGYTIFGRVIGGMNGVVDATERGDKVETIGIDEKKE